MQIAEVCRKYNITADTIRYYEKIGLLPKIPRTKNGIRDFDEESCKWIEFIKCMRNAGMEIEILLEYVNLFKKGKFTVKERRNLLKAYGAKVVLTPKEEGMAGAVLKAQSLANEIPNAIILGQFDNQNNVLAHYETTGPEIEDQMDHQIDFFVATIGTGGTISGVGKYLKEKNPHVQIIGVEPEGSPFLTKGKAGFHKIQGIGAGFQPSILDLSVIDQIVTVTDKEAYRYSQSLAKKEGLCVGISSGAAMAAAAKIAKQYPNKRIVVLFADSGERYLSTDLYREEI